MCRWIQASKGLVGNNGCIPVSRRQDVVGSLPRTVRDAAYMLNTMAGRSEHDNMTWEIPFDLVPDFTAFCEKTDLKESRVGVPRNAFSTVAAPIMEAFEKALEILAGAGAQIIDNTNFDSVVEFKKLDKPAKNFCITSEFKSDPNKYFESLQTNPHGILTVDDLIAFTKTFPQEEYPDRDIEKFLWTETEGADIADPKYKMAMEGGFYFAGSGGILGTMEMFNLDVLVVPSTIEIPIFMQQRWDFSSFLSH